MRKKTVLKISTFLFLLWLIISVSAIIFISPEVLNDISCTYSLEIIDGELYVEGSKEDINSRIPITVNKKDWYQLTMSGEASGDVPSDFILAMVLYDEQENEIAYVTGDMFDASMVPMELEVGDYYLEMYHVANENNLNNLIVSLEKGRKPIIEKEGFSTDGKWNIDFRFKMENDGKHQVTYLILTGLIIVAVLIVLMIAFRKNETSVDSYDERQILARGAAYKYGFFTMLVYFLMLNGFYAFDITAKVDNSVLMILGIFAGCAVFGTYSIWHDAYFRLNEKKTTVMLSLLVILGANLLSLYMNIKESRILVDGKIMMPASNVIVVVLLMIFIIEVMIKSLVSRENEEDEES